MLYWQRPTTHGGRVSRRARRPGTHMLRLRLTLLVCLFAFAGFAAEPGAAQMRTHPQAAGLLVARYAHRFIGAPYSYGGSSPSGFDCSGFVAFVYRHFGVELPHYTFAQYGLGRRVAREQLEPGDLVFFDGLNHVGLYVGHGRFIHAPHSGARVRVEPLGASGRFDGARRIF
jgi:cell wall-associated NlpC family hydrolase